MSRILLIGAGRSASSLIRYLLENSQTEGWEIVIADISEKLAKEKLQGHKNGKALLFDVHNDEQRGLEIKKADIVISLLPPHLHFLVAKDCVDLQKNLVTASYVSKEIRELDKAAKEAGILLLNEMGLDPGIDHMSAMKMIDEIKTDRGEIISFKSYTGGLIAPESNDNPWGYKFTWNPRNVVLAGQGTAQYIEENKLKYVPYNRIFSNPEIIEIDRWGKFEGYPNRDSLSYRPVYGLSNIPTMIRGTLRNIGFCEAWNVFVKLGLTDDSYQISNSASLTYAQLLESFLPKGNENTKEKLVDFSGHKNDSDTFKKLEWLGIFEDKAIPLSNASPAAILQNLLEDKWLLQKNDIDMIVMQHQLEYIIEGKRMLTLSSLVVKGDDSLYTAMAKTVGLPLGIAAKLILKGIIKAKGVVIPINKEIYEPVLHELEQNGIVFEEKTT